MARRTSIDLFAGCGGLSRGLEEAGFDCLAFNELNLDAAESFCANFKNALPFVGDIRDVLSDDVVRNRLDPIIEERGGLDLLTGGPPCQGFSGIGHRRTHKLDREDIPTNHLFKEMIRLIKSLKPKVFLFENVQGILTGKWTSKGEKGEIFREVWNSFNSIEGYTSQPTLLHAYGFGVPQNRPRVMIMGIRNDMLEKLAISPTPFDSQDTSVTYASMLRNNGGFFPHWDEENIQVPDPIDVLSDLDFEGWSTEHPFYRKRARSTFQKRLRKGVPTTTGGRLLLTDHQFSNHRKHVSERFEYMIRNNISKNKDLPEDMQTKKFSQKLLPKRWSGKPTITVTSLPDDYIHYNKPRTLSVREWARLQTFPDKHVFCGKRTTGGERRAGNPEKDDWYREVPKYTQIGNAVPPFVAEAVGKKIHEILSIAES